MSNHRQDLDTRQNHSVPNEQQLEYWSNIIYHTLVRRVSSQETSASIQDTKVIFGDHILLSREV